MSEIGTPDLNAEEVDAERVEWAENCEISIPAKDNTFFTQRAMVHIFTGLCGLT